MDFIDEILKPWTSNEPPVFDPLGPPPPRYEDELQAMENAQAHLDMMPPVARIAALKRNGLLSPDTVYAPPKIGNNDRCHCGSGKKYKKCCKNADEEAAKEANAG